MKREYFYVTLAVLIAILLYFVIPKRSSSDSAILNTIKQNNDTVKQIQSLLKKSESKVLDLNKQVKIKDSLLKQNQSQIDFTVQILQAKLKSVTKTVYKTDTVIIASRRYKVDSIEVSLDGCAKELTEYKSRDSLNDAVITVKDSIINQLVVERDLLTKIKAIDGVSMSEQANVLKKQKKQITGLKIERDICLGLAIIVLFLKIL